MQFVFDSRWPDAELADTWAKFPAVTTRNFLEIDALVAVRGIAAVNSRIHACPYKPVFSPLVKSELKFVSNARAR